MALFEKGVDGVGYLLKERVGDAADLVNALTTVAAADRSLTPRWSRNSSVAGRYPNPRRYPG